MNKKKVKQIFIAFGVAVLILILYAIFSGGFSQPIQNNDSLVSVRGKQIQGGQIDEGDMEIINERILRILRGVKDIELNGDIFSNPVFKQLRDTRFTLPRPVRLGRPNPFAPIGFESVREAQQNSSVGEEDTQDVSHTTFFDGSNSAGGDDSL